MTSQINPATIDGNYPIAGVPNNTQGMRDNFTAIKTNFQFAETEIDDLQSKGVFKAALTGTTLDNNMANNLIYNAKIQGFSGTLVQIANTTGAITVDCSAGHVQTIVMGGNISISFTTATWPAAGSVGIVRLIITVDTANRTLTLPANVSLGVTGIQGYSANVITFAAAGTYEFGFLTYDQGTIITLFDYNRPLSYYTNSVTIADTTATTSAVTGALTVAGGVGIGGNLYVTGDIFGNVTLTDISVSSVTATGNVVGGNINTAGLVSVTGNVIGGNVNAGIVSATGNVQGGNLRTAGLISATGNITGGNITGAANVNATTHTGTTVSVTGNVTGGNINTAGLTSATGNVIGGNVSTAGLITATGNITGGNILSSAVLSAVGNAVVLSGTAIPTGGTAGAGYKFSSTANFGIFFGSGAPTLSAAKGSLYLRSDGTTTNDRMYVNTNGSTTWTAVTTVA
jgi:hypothetical protein